MHQNERLLAKLSAKIWVFFKHGLNGLNLSGALLVVVVIVVVTVWVVDDI